MIGFILGPDRNSGSGPLRYPFRWNLGWYRFRLGTGRFGRYQTGTAFFCMLYLGFMMSYLHHVPPPVLWLDHVHPSSSQTESRATLQFPDCITCSPPVPWLYHMLPSSSQTVSRATLEFTKQGCTPPPNAAAPVKFATPPHRGLSRRCVNLKSKILAKIKFYILTICNLSESFKKLELMRKDFSFHRRPFDCHDLTTYNALSYIYIIFNKYINKYIKIHK